MSLKEALLYKKLKDQKVQCQLCPRFCIIAEENVGNCKVRINKKGILYSLIYNQVAAIANDPIEKKPLYNFYPGSKVLSVGTAGCNFHCMHCQNWSISQAVPEDLSLETITAQQLVSIAKRAGSHGVAWTYNEPTIWLEYMLEGAQLAKAAGLYTVSVTNGYITEEALQLIGPLIDAYALDIKSLDDNFAQNICGVPSFQPVLTAAKIMKHTWHAHIEVTTNVIPGKNDSDIMLVNIAEWIVENLGNDVSWHISRAFPYYKMKDFEPTSMEILEKARHIGEVAGLKNVYIGNV